MTQNTYIILGAWDVSSLKRKAQGYEYIPSIQYISILCYTTDHTKCFVGDNGRGTALSLGMQLDKVYICTLVPRVLTMLYTYLGEARRRQPIWSK